MCKYCNGESMMIMGTGYDNIYLSMGKYSAWNCYNLFLSYQDEDGFSDEIFSRIKYCSFCGRKLED